jgi:hypothetical protein
MKLSLEQIQLECAYQAILADIQLHNGRHQYSFDYTPRRPRHVLPREQPHPSVLLPPIEYPTQHVLTICQAKAKFMQLQAFQATFKGTITPMSPDMCP